MKQMRVIVFILSYGVLSGLILSFNLWLTNYVSYWAIFTGLLLLFFIFFFFIKLYEYIVHTKLTRKRSLFHGFPVFLIALIIFNYFIDFNGTIHYTNYGKLELIRNWSCYGASMTFFLTFIILPLYDRVHSRSKEYNK
jgi:hypothetical protein